MLLHHRIIIPLPTRCLVHHDHPLLLRWIKVECPSGQCSRLLRRGWSGWLHGSVACKTSGTLDRQCIFIELAIRISLVFRRALECARNRMANDRVQINRLTILRHRAVHDRSDQNLCELVLQIGSRNSVAQHSIRSPDMLRMLLVNAFEMYVQASFLLALVAESRHFRVFQLSDPHNVRCASFKWRILIVRIIKLTYLHDSGHFNLSSVCVVRPKNPH